MSVYFQKLLVLTAATILAAFNCMAQDKSKSGKTIKVVLPIGHTEYVKSCEFSTDGRFILTASLDKNIILWDVKTGYELLRYEGSPLGVMKAVFSPDNRFVASVGWDLKIRLWNMETGELISVFSEGMNCVCFSKDGSLLYADTKDGRIGIFKAATGEKTGEIRAHSNAINDMSLSPDGSRLYSSSTDGTCKVWNLSTNKLIHTFVFSKGAVQDAVSGVSGLIAYGCNDGTVCICDQNTFSKVSEFKAHETGVVDVDFSHNGKMLSTTGWDGRIKIWNPATGELLKSIDSHKFLVYDAAFSPDDKYIATCGTDKDVKLWDVETGTLLRYYTGHVTKLSSIDIDFEKGILMAGLWDQIRFESNRPVFWNIRNGSLETGADSHSFILNAVDIAPDAVASASVGDDARIITWDVNNGSVLQEYRLQQGNIKDLCYFADGTRIATACSDNYIRIWNRNFDSPPVEIDCKNEGLVCITVSNDNTRIAVAFRDGNVSIWSIISQKWIATVPAHKESVYDIKFSKDDKYLVTASYDKTAVVWETNDFKRISEFKAHEWIVSTIAISEDSKTVYTGSWDRSICAWSLTTGTLIKKFTGHNNYVSGLSVSPDGKLLFSCSWDGSIIAWRTDTGEIICKFITVDNDDWMIVTPDNYYMGSKDAARKVSFSSEMNSYGFEQFDLQYNRPDKVLEQLPWADTALIPVYRKAYEKRLNKSGFNESWFGPDFHSPEIKIVNRNNIPLLTESNSIDLKLMAIDSIYKLKSINVWVNGVPCFGLSGISFDGHIKNNDFQVDIPLSTGKNRIEVACMNEKGVYSLKDEIEIVKENESVRKPDLYLISLAVSEFDDSRYNLKYTVNDGRGFIQTFSGENNRYGNIFIDSIYNDNCTLENLDGIRKKLMKTHVDDEVIVHVAGHGLLDENQDFYFAVSDIDFKNPSKKGIKYSVIESLLDSIPARNKLLLLDACHSGEVDYISEVQPLLTENARARGVVMYKMPAYEINASDINLKNSFDLMRELFVDVRRSTGAVVISAASGAGYAIEREDLQNGIFTFCIIEALSSHNADKNNDGNINVSELRDYVMQRVRELSDGQQFPTSRKENLSNDFIVW